MSLVERTEELRVLEETFTGEQCPGSVVLVEGAAALGKTSLLDAFARRVAETGGVFLDASASRVERGLPLSAVGRLFQSPVLSSVARARADRLLRDGAYAARACGAGFEPDAAVGVPASVLGGLSEILLSAAQRAPLAIGVDDIHHADPSSLHFLLHLARRTGSARVLLVLTQCVRTSRPHPLLHAELLRRPGSRRLRLAPLSRQGVLDLLSDHFEPGAARRLAAECHRASGGNPLLAHALIEDTLTAGPAPSGRLVLGDAFRQAVLTCLFHSESTALARGMAVLAEDASDPVLGELVQYDAESIALAREALRATGLLESVPTEPAPSAGVSEIPALANPTASPVPPEPPASPRFRHPAVPAAVLSGMRPEARTALYVRVARVLHGHGAPAPVVARRLLAADRADAPWAVAVLRDAAQQARAEGRAPQAVSCLRLALQECADADQRAAVLLDLADAEWQLDPVTAARRLPDLVRAVRDGRLPASSAALPVSWLLWLGRVDEALALLDRVAERTGPGRAPAPLRWLRYGYPGLARQPGFEEHFTAREEPSCASAASPLTHSCDVGALLAGALLHGAHHETVHRAEQILRRPGHHASTLRPAVAMAALTYVEELERAERACDRFARSVAQGPPLRNALFTAVRAAIHLRRGELEKAEKFAHESLTLISPQGWGVALGLPLSVMLATLTARGRHDEVEHHLDLAVPDAMFHTPLCLPYLQARGHHYLLRGRPHAALAEFQACGELMTRWGCDIPGFVAWRTDLAAAQLALGDRAAAGRLASEQLQRLRPRQFRARGAALRVLAAACDPDARVKGLGTAVLLLEKSGDRLELARALADLGEAYRARGQEGPARAMEQRSRLIAAECGAEEPGDPAPPSPLAPDVPAAVPDEDDDPLAGLSEAERRVAALAASGYTNRQIAQRLHVTTSTVEQHLTRVYRKLNVHRRTDLPLHLMLPLEGHPA